MHKLINLTLEQDKYYTGNNGIITGYCMSYSGNVRNVKSIQRGGSAHTGLSGKGKRPILEINHE